MRLISTQSKLPLVTGPALLDLKHFHIPSYRIAFPIPLFPFSISHLSLQAHQVLMMLCDVSWPSVTLISLQIVLLEIAIGSRLTAVTLIYLNGSCAKSVSNLLQFKNKYHLVCLGLSLCCLTMQGHLASYI